MPFYQEKYGGLIWNFEPANRRKNARIVASVMGADKPTPDYPIALRRVPRDILRSARAALAAQVSP